MGDGVRHRTAGQTRPSRFLGAVACRGIKALPRLPLGDFPMPLRVFPASGFPNSPASFSRTQGNPRRRSSIIGYQRAPAPPRRSATSPGNATHLMTTIPRPQPLPGGGWRRPNSGTKCLDIRPKQLFLGYFSYADPPPISHLAAHTGVESHLSYGTAPNANGWQVDWVQASVWLRRGADDHGTWIAKKEFFLAVRSSDDPRRQLQGQRMLIDLLKHEQGHFDITALLMRDQFNDVVALFNTVAGLVSANCGATMEYCLASGVPAAFESGLRAAGRSLVRRGGF